MAGCFWVVVPCNLVIFRVPQLEYPDDVGGRFLQNVSTSQKNAFVVAFLKTSNPTNLLNFLGGGGSVACTSGCLETDRVVLLRQCQHSSTQNICPQQFCPMSINWCRGAQIAGARTPHEAAFFLPWCRKCVGRDMKSVPFLRFDAKNFEVAPRSMESL